MHPDIQASARSLATLNICPAGDRLDAAPAVSLAFAVVLRRGRLMSFQVTVLKVLAGLPNGRASIADLTRAVSILISVGPEWTDRTKRLAARAPGLEIFTQAFVLRDQSGWSISDAGRKFLASIEAPPEQLSAGEEPGYDQLTLSPNPSVLKRPVTPLRGRRRAARKRAAA
jgi:hypothetical protein